MFSAIDSGASGPSSRAPAPAETIVFVLGKKAYFHNTSLHPVAWINAGEFTAGGGGGGGGITLACKAPHKVESRNTLGNLSHLRT